MSSPIAERTGWLYHKAVAYVVDNYGHIPMPLARIRAVRDSSPQGLLEALEDGVVMDIALCEGGMFEAFLADRGELLPPDELDMAELWALQERSVFDVESARAGVSVTLRDVRTGDVRLVPERTASQQIHKGDLICTRLLPVGDSWQIYGGVEPVLAHECAWVNPRSRPVSPSSRVVPRQGIGQNYAISGVVLQILFGGGPVPDR